MSEVDTFNWMLAAGKHGRQPNEKLDLALMIQTYIFFSIYSIILLVILCKVKFRLYLGFGVILFNFEFYFLIKALLNTFFYMHNEGNDSPGSKPVLYSVTRCISSLTNRIKWFILYFFILKVKTIVIKLDADNPEDNRMRQLLWETRKKQFYAVFLPASLVVFGVSVAEEYRRI